MQVVKGYVGYISLIGWNIGCACKRNPCSKQFWSIKSLQKLRDEKLYAAYFHLRLIDEQSTACCCSRITAYKFIDSL